MEKLIKDRNGFDLAKEIIKGKFRPSLKQKAKEYLEICESLEAKIGDNDNPFNPDVNYLIEITEIFVDFIDTNIPD